MGYLICEKCRGYYELQKGESIDNFQGCECGGKFRYAENIDRLNMNTNSNDTKKDNNALFCANCGSKNLNSSTFCKKCGEKLYKPYSEAKRPKNMKNEPLFEVFEKSLRRDIKRGEKWWSKQTKQTRGVVVIVGVLLLIGIAAGAYNSISQSSSQSSYQSSYQSIEEKNAIIKANAQKVNAVDLYLDRGALIGEPVMMKGKVVDTGQDSIRVVGTTRMSNSEVVGSYDIMVYGDFSDTTVYEGNIVMVYGNFMGQTSYTTVMGANRNIPGIVNGFIEPARLNG